MACRSGPYGYKHVFPREAVAQLQIYNDKRHGDSTSMTSSSQRRYRTLLAPSLFTTNFKVVVSRHLPISNPSAYPYPLNTKYLQLQQETHHHEGLHQRCDGMWCDRHSMRLFFVPFTMMTAVLALLPIVMRYLDGKINGIWWCAVGGGWRGEGARGHQKWGPEVFQQDQASCAFDGVRYKVWGNKAVTYIPRGKSTLMSAYPGRVMASCVCVCMLLKTLLLCGYHVCTVYTIRIILMLEQHSLIYLAAFFSVHGCWEGEGE